MNEPAPPPGFYQLPGQSPDGRDKCFFVVAKDAILEYYRDTGNSFKYLESFLIPEVLESPTGTWKNLERYGQEAAMC